MGLLEGNECEKKLVEIRSQQGSFTLRSQSLGVTALFRRDGKVVTDSSRCGHFTIHARAFGVIDQLHGV